MQVYSRKSFALATVALALICRVVSDAPPPTSFLSVDPTNYLTITLGTVPNCKAGNEFGIVEDCITTEIVPGACYKLWSWSSAKKQLNDNLQSLTWNKQKSNFTCRLFYDWDCHGLFYDFDQTTGPNSIPDDFKAQTSSIRCGSWSDIRQEYALVTGKFTACQGTGMSAPCYTVYPYLNRCYNFVSKMAGNVNSMTPSFGMACTIYSEQGCSGIKGEYPIGYKSNMIPNVGWFANNDPMNPAPDMANLAMSFFCQAAL